MTAAATLAEQDLFLHSLVWNNKYEDLRNALSRSKVSDVIFHFINQRALNVNIRRSIIRVVIDTVYRLPSFQPRQLMDDNKGKKHKVLKQTP